MAELTLTAVIYDFQGGAPPWRGHYKGSPVTIKVKADDPVSKIAEELKPHFGRSRVKLEGVVGLGSVDEGPNKWYDEENPSIWGHGLTLGEKVGDSFSDGDVFAIKKDMPPGMRD
eukprot:CAMPEP_0174251114 /NCGR_PEP_ID=MMETSP0439-20130205/1048_1 /TAXON_ID=0 /ORGANISM="Stereomyxa ramosa, Strain Chinc5" /LENGTH=114 /DNA_ID=CAMNT_0015331351 /DNA_START=43 /DNA_END=387 /DNA_ORIENTATION=+